MNIEVGLEEFPLAKFREREEIEKERERGRERSILQRSCVVDQTIGVFKGKWWEVLII
jgi:hypothetical protein